MKRPRLVVAGIILVSATVGACGSPESNTPVTAPSASATTIAPTPTPVPTSAAPSTPAPSTSTPPRNARYETVEDLKDAAVEAGLPCPEYDQTDVVLLAKESADCSDEAVLSVYQGKGQVAAQMKLSNQMDQALLNAGIEPDPSLVGTNWIIRAPNVQELQPVMGGTVHTAD